MFRTIKTTLLASAVGMLLCGATASGKPVDATTQKKCVKVASTMTIKTDSMRAEDACSAGPFRRQFYLGNTPRTSGDSKHIKFQVVDLHTVPNDVPCSELADIPGQLPCDGVLQSEYVVATLKIKTVNSVLKRVILFTRRGSKAHGDSVKFKVISHTKHTATVSANYLMWDKVRGTQPTVRVDAAKG